MGGPGSQGKRQDPKVKVQQESHTVCNDKVSKLAKQFTEQVQPKAESTTNPLLRAGSNTYGYTEIS